MEQAVIIFVASDYLARKWIMDSNSAEALNALQRCRRQVEVLH
jgi:hypothetical protein